MKKIQLLLFIVLTSLALSVTPHKAKADHCAGGELIYEWIADSTYRFILKFYRDCNGIDAYANQPLCLFNPCTSTSATVTMNKWTGPLPDGRANGDPVAAGCSGYPTKCESPGSGIPGYREWWYTCIVTLPAQCNAWKFAIWISARNYSLNIPGGYLYLETTFNNTGSFQGNSSPYFSIKPVPYACINQATTYNNGAIDPNGDSLVTDIINPLTGSSCSSPPTPLTLNSSSPPLNIPNNPFQTNNTFTTNAATGNIGFTPALTGPGTITVRVKEYRNGVLIGYIMRDVQVQVLPCSSVIPTLSTVQSTITGGGWLNNRVNGCVNTPLSFSYEVTSTDTAAVLIASDNHSVSFPAANIVYSNQKSDSIRGTFTWTPAITDIGLKTLVVTIKDSTCRPPGILLYQTFTVPIYVWPPVTSVPDTNICPGETAYLNASGGGNYVWSVMPGGSPISSLSCTNCQAPVASPLLTTTYVVTSSTNPFCPNNSDTVKVGVLPSLNFVNIPDTITCPQNSVALDLKTTPPPGVSYKAKWTPATFLNSDTMITPITTPNSTITYRVVLTSSINKCKGYDTVVVNVLSGFLLGNKDTAVCAGQTVGVYATGDSRYSFAWTHTSSAIAPFSNTGILTPVITPASSATPSVPDTATYRLIASYQGCRDSSQEFKIEVQPIPTVTVDNDEEMCEGDTLRIHGTVTPSYYPYDITWSPGASLSNNKVLNPLFKAQQTSIITLYAKSGANCIDSDDIKITVFPSQFLSAKGDTALCPGSSTQIHVSGNGIKTFHWSPDLHISDKKGNDPFVWPNTTTTYTVYAVDTNACKDTAVVKVVVHPKATIYLPDSARIYPGEAYQMDPTGNCSYFSWFPPVGLNKSDISNPVAKPEVNTRYVLNGRTESGCATSDSITLYVSPESIVDLANAFTPGSEPNGTFKVVRRGDIILKNFSIYNRWGLKVFETSDVNKGWDGSYNNQPQPTGVYIYTVEGVTSTGRKFTKQGNVTLIR